MNQLNYRPMIGAPSPRRVPKPYLVAEQIGDSIVFVPELRGNRYENLDAESMTLAAQIRAGVPLQQVPQLISLEGAYGADYVTDFYNNLKIQIENADKHEDER